MRQFDLIAVPPFVRIAVKHNTIHRGRHLHHWQVGLLLCQSLFLAADAGTHVIDFALFLNSLAVDLHLNFFQIKFCLFHLVIQRFHLGRVVIAQEYFACAFRTLKRFFRIGNRGLQRRELLFLFCLFIGVRRTAG